ncbi:uncharacterized protein Pyn_23313 [Prunus yedoensis var. nudiflora]|uniref:Uncharacterized protein n=1 Tax=Prunus yedoensis var. nudiflora TaxID=2094558 RepID=A0A314Z5K5_PRUYE|nr:uncharacterized protein Pyn_23313 [Prunus yedoensis var. nudiflora]
MLQLRDIAKQIDFSSLSVVKAKAFSASSFLALPEPPRCIPKGVALSLFQGNLQAKVRGNGGLLSIHAQELVGGYPSIGVVESIIRSGWVGEVGLRIEKVLRVHHSLDVLRGFEEYRKMVKSKYEKDQIRKRVESNGLYSGILKTSWYLQESSLRPAVISTLLEGSVLKPSQLLIRQPALSNDSNQQTKRAPCLDNIRDPFS